MLHHNICLFFFNLLKKNTITCPKNHQFEVNMDNSIHIKQNFINYFIVFIHGNARVKYSGLCAGIAIV